MKHFFSGMILTLALVLAIVVGVVALAETAEPQAPELPAVEDAQPSDEAAEPEAPATDTATDATALQDALNAYRAAKESSHAEELETELNGYVASGKLTQEQADLILNYYNEQQSLRNGTCPNCGYAFQNNGGFGKGGRMGGKGGRGHGGRGGFGGMNGFGQAPSMDQQPGATPDSGSANGTSFEPDWDFQADEDTFGGI